MKFHDLKKGMRLRVVEEHPNWGYKKDTILVIDSDEIIPQSEARYVRKNGDRILITQIKTDILGNTYESRGYRLTEKAFNECKIVLDYGYQSPLWKVLNGEEIE